jgi:uncharacterized protein YqeY
MTIAERLEADMKAALRARDTARLGAIRLIRAQLQAREVALREKHGRDWKITDEEALAALAAYAKQRRDSIEGYRAGGREEQALEEEHELAVVNEYLPQQLGPDELRAIVREAVAQSGATSAKDLGQVMKLVLPRVKGQADGRVVNELVREALGGS